MHVPDQIVLSQDGPETSLVRHWLLRGQLTTEMTNVLPSLCEYLKAPLDDYVNEKGIGTDSYLTHGIYWALQVILAYLLFGGFFKCQKLGG